LSKQRRSDGWCLRYNGRFKPWTFAETRHECWSIAFVSVANAEGLEWQRRYWKRWSPSIRSARRRGWRVVRVRLVEVE
jgi:hypothetical protein